jgi:hypothetical protein
MTRPTDQDFGETYRSLSEEEIAAIYAEIGSLTEEARNALVAEIQSRGLDQTQLQKLHAVELRHEAQFDRREKYRRKRMIFGRSSGLHSVKEWIGVILIALVLVLISELISRRH